MSLRYKLVDRERVGTPVRGELIGAGEKLGGIDGADYYGTVYPVFETAGARTARSTTEGSTATRAGVEPARRSSFANLRQPQFPPSKDRSASP